MDKSVNRANEKLNFLSDEEEVSRMDELRKKGEADRIAQGELAVERAIKKWQMETSKKMLDKGYSSSEISEVLDIPEQTIQRWCESEMDSIPVIQTVSREGLKSEWKAGGKSSSKVTIASNRATLMNKVPKNSQIYKVLIKEQAKEVKAALEKLGYKVTDGVNKDISHPNYSGIIGRYRGRGL